MKPAQRASQVTKRAVLARRDLQTASGAAFSLANRLETLGKLYRWLKERIETDGAPPYWDKGALTEARAGVWS